MKAMIEMIPELEACKGIEQPSDFHHLDVFNHCVEAAKSVDEVLRQTKFQFSEREIEVIRFAALIHDVGKPMTKTFDIEKNRIRFSNHDEVSAEMAPSICKRFDFNDQEIETIVKLVKYHMYIHNIIFLFNNNELSKKAFRRFVKKVETKKFAEMLFVIRHCDHLAAQGFIKSKELDFRFQDWALDQI